MKIENLPLFIYVQYITKDGKVNEAHIQTRNIGDRKQDAKIGDFSENWWIRPKKAVEGKEYKTMGAYKSACTLSLKANGYAQEVLGYSEESKA
jgi:hypothetical protein